MIIFPLSIPGKIVLVLIAIVLGLIFAMMQWPDFFKKHFRKGAAKKPEETKKP